MSITSEKYWDEEEAYEILEELKEQQAVDPEITVHDVIDELLEREWVWCDSCRCMHDPQECFTDMN